jgi:predicted lipoprotein
MKKKQIAGMILTTTFSLLLTACGGGGGDSVVVKPAPPVTPTQPTTTSEEEFGKWLVDLGNNYILPSYQVLADRAGEMNDHASVFCAQTNPNTEGLTGLQNAWRKLNQSWQTIQWVKVGPIVDDNRLFRVHYWPDSKGSVGSGVDKLLSLNETITEDIVANQSVGAQGIPAIENLLFTKQSTSLLNAPDKAKRCEALMAISSNVLSIGIDLVIEWRPADGNFIAQLTEGTGEFSSKKDAVEELVTNWLEQIERVKDEKMLVPLGDNAPGFPDIVEQSLSAESIASIKTNVATFKAIYTAGEGHGFDDILITHFDQQNIATEMLSAIDNAIASANALDDNYIAQLNDEAGRIKITETISNLRLLRDILTADFVQATDINIGFNSNDGD